MANISERLFSQIERSVPFSSVDLMVFKDNKIILTKRRIPPYRNYWHLPGSIVKKGERVIETVRRSAKEELGISIDSISFINYYDSVFRTRHYVSHLFITEYAGGEIKLNFQSSDFLFASPDLLPKNIIPLHKRMIEDVMQLRSYKEVGSSSITQNHKTK